MAVLLVLGMGVATGVKAQGSQHPSPDIRIFVIDNDLFASISDSTERQLAVDDLLEDIRQIDETAPASLETIVFYKRGASLREIRDLGSGENLHNAIASSRPITRIQSQSQGAAIGLSLGDLRNEVRRKILNDRRNIQSVDLHIFAANWYQSGTDYQQMDQPTYCMSQADPNVQLWPSNITLTVEFRPPESVEQPSHSAQANLIGFLVGTSASQNNILTRWVSGPRCPMRGAEVAVGYGSGGPGAIDCSAGPVPRTDDAGFALGCRTTSAPPLAVGFAPRPVNMIAFAVDPQANSAAWQVSPAPSGQSVKLQIGGVSLEPGTSAPLSRTLPSGTYAGQIDITTDASCNNPQSWQGQIDLGQGSVIDVTVAQPSCHNARLSLPQISVQ